MAPPAGNATGDVDADFHHQLGFHQRDVQRLAAAPPGGELSIRLGRSARPLDWVSIWRDPAGATAVRAANDGNETVPTIVVAGQPHTNPDPEWVREQLSPSA